MKKKKMKYKKYNPLKHMKTQTAMMTTESIGYAIPFMVAGSIPSPAGRAVTTRAATTGSMLAGVPSLTHGAVGVVGSLGMLRDVTKKKRRK